MDEKYLKDFQPTIMWLLDENHNHKYMTPLKIIKKFYDKFTEKYQVM